MDSFFQGLSSYLLKQVDDLLIQAESIEDMERYLDETLSDAEKHGITFSIKKFTVSSKVVFSGFQLDASSGTVKIGPDPARVEKLLTMPKPTSTKQVQRLLGLLTQLSKFCPDYAMSCPRQRALSHKWQPMSGTAHMTRSLSN